jgi:hypothetical protein
MFGMLFEGLKGRDVAALLSLAMDFATWKKLHREHGMTSKAIAEMWLDIIRCRAPE